MKFSYMLYYFRCKVSEFYQNKQGKDIQKKIRSRLLTKIRYTLTDIYGDGFYIKVVLFNMQAPDTGLTVLGLGLVKDEIADAIIDLLAVIVLYSL